MRASVEAGAWRGSRRLTGDARAFRWGAVVVMIVAVVVYLPSLGAGLVSDDFFFTQQPWSLNPFVLLGGTWGHQGGPGVVYRPVTQWSYALNQATQSAPWGFHLMNIVAHAATAVLVAVLARRLGAGAAGSTVAGIAFALHPVHHEGVAWISGRTVVLSTLLAVAALLAVTRPARRQQYALLAAGLAGLAMLSYEGVVLLPVMLGVLAVLFGARTAPALWRVLSPVLLVWVIYFAWRWSAVSTPADDAWAHSSAVTLEGLAAPVLERAVANARALAVRVLGAGVGVPPTQSLTFWTTTIAVAASVVLIVRERRLVPSLLASWSVAALAFGAFLTLIGYADRFAYFPSIAVCLTLGFGAHVAMAGDRWLRAAAAGTVVVLCLLWSRQLVLAERDWIEAGHVAAAIPAQAVRILPAPAHGAHVHVVGAPLNIRAAYVYITYFHLAMAQAYGRDDLTVTMNPDPRATCDAGEGQDADSCLRWDALTGQLAIERAAVE